MKGGFAWEECFMFDGKLISLNDFIKILFGKLPLFFKDDEDLHTQWQNPKTRTALLDQLEREGFPLEKIRMVQSLLNMDKCDLLDVLEYLAYNTTPIEREQRVALVKADIVAALNQQQTAFVDFVLQQYIQQGYGELSMENLPELIKLKYGTINDAKAELGSIGEINKVFVGFQKNLYAA